MATTGKRRRSSNLWLHGRTWWCRLRYGGVTKRISTQARADQEDLGRRRRDLFEEMARRDKHPDLLAGVLAGRVTLEALHDAYHAEDLARLKTQASSVNLAPLVPRWLAALRADQTVRPATIVDYEHMVGTLMPAGRPFYAAALTPQAVRVWLRELRHRRKPDQPVSIATRRHYFDALRAFVRWLIAEHQVWERSPLGGMEVPALGKPRAKYMTFPELLASIDAITHEVSRMAVTAMAATGMELSACQRVTARDVLRADRVLWAHGTKSEYRDRPCYVRAWGWERLEPYLRGLIGGAKAFPRNETLLRQDWYAGQLAALGWGPGQRNTLHDLRHTYCWLAFTGEDGDEVKDPQYCADQLGHGSLAQVAAIYGKNRLRDRQRLIDSRRRDELAEADETIDLGDGRRIKLV